MTAALHGRTAFVTGGSRGIGLAIAKRLGAAGANVAILAKTAEPHPNLPGTVYTAAEEIEGVGGHALPIVGDIRDEEGVAEAVAKTVDEFGGIDICVNNASAINVSNIENLPVRRYDLIQSINSRGTFVVSQACVPHLRKSDSAHVVTLSPPVNLAPRWLGPHAPYTLSKYGMTLLTLGLAEELKDDGVSAYCLWPETMVATAAIANVLGDEETLRRCRRPEIVADAAYELVTSGRFASGGCYVDSTILEEVGGYDIEGYAVDPTLELLPDGFLD